MRAFWHTLLFWALLTGCAGFEAHGYRWREDIVYRPSCLTYAWVQEDPMQVAKACKAHADVTYLGCTLPKTCVVVSMYDERTAATIFLPGTDWSHRDHEVKGHILNRWVHP